MTCRCGSAIDEVRTAQERLRPAQNVNFMARQESHLPEKPDGTSIETSPLDQPLNATYVRVIIIEAVIIVLLVIVGRIFS